MENIMSRTIRNEQTKGYLDKLAAERKTRKLLRELKADEMMQEMSNYSITN